MVIKHVNPLSYAKISALIGAAMGVLVGAFMSLFAIFGAAMGGREGGFLAMIFGIGAIILMPIFYGICGLIGALIGAVVYNFAAASSAASKSTCIGWAEPNLVTQFVTRLTASDIE
jgi:hypothetical protein